MEFALTDHQDADHILIERIVQQDAGALEALYDRYAQPIYNLIVRMVRDKATADDLLQETFWQVWRSAGKFSGRGSAAAWLHRIARNKSIDHLRRRQVRPQPLLTASEAEEAALWAQLPHEDVGVEKLAASRWESADLRRAMQEIPPEQRQCLLLAYFEGLSQRQISEVTNTPLGTVKTRLRMGVEKLERILRAAGYEQQDIY